MKINDWVVTPRFCLVKINEMFDSREAASAAGYTEPTYYKSERYGVAGKTLDMYHMVFCGYQK